jgi:zinc transporter ZupT
MDASSTFEGAILASGLACIFTTMGILLVRRHEGRAMKYSGYFMSFAVGVLVGVSFLHLVPESLSQNRDEAPTCLLAGFLAFYVLDRVLGAYVCHRYEDSGYSIGLLPTLGVGVHSLLDGVMYSVTFSVSVFTGALAALGMVLHEFPEGVLTFVLLRRGGFDRRASVTYSFLAAAISTPLGTLISCPFVDRLKGSTLGGLLAISAGALIYVGASHLLPVVHREGRKYTGLSLVSGVMVAMILVLCRG